MEKLHERTLSRCNDYKGWIRDVKKLDSLQHKIDKFVNLLEENQKSVINTWVCNIDVTVNINHTKEIPLVLRKAIEVFGKISGRDVNPAEKTFRFAFSKVSIELKFFLSGSSCVLVETGEIIEKKKYKLVCSNGNEEEITPESIGE